MPCSERLGRQYQRCACDCQREAQRDITPFQAIVQNATLAAAKYSILFFQPKRQLDWWIADRRFVRAAFAER